jgi:flagellar hook-basal body complex protein FliE
MTTPIGPIAPIASLGGAGALAGMTGPSAPGGAARIAGTAAAGTPGAGIEGTDTRGGTNFAAALGHGLDALTASQRDADELAVQAATGRLTDPAQLTIATTRAQMMTQLATTVQSKAVAAFKTIMSLQG